MAEATKKQLNKVGSMFTTPVRQSTPPPADRSRKPVGNGDQRTCED